MDLPPPEPGDAFRMLLDGDNVVIEFGRMGAAGASNPETLVNVTDRVVLPIEIGRRLLHTLGHAIKPHEALLRAARAKALSPGEAGLAARPGLAPARPAQDRSGEQAARLLRLVSDLGIPHQYERSLRMSAGALQANRFLLTVDPADLSGNPCERVLTICDQMGMPERQRAAAATQFGHAKAIHFGFEGDANAIIAKLYLEHAVSADAARRAHAMGEPVLMHLSYKWNSAGTDPVTTQYVWHPLLNAEEIELRLDGLYAGAANESRDIAQAFLRLAAANVAGDRLQYLEVTELENDRRSFDLNLYNAKLTVKDAQALLQRMRLHFGLRPGQVQALYDQIKSMPLGHLAGGVHRNGRDFFNVYYGMVNLPKFNKQLLQT